MANRAGSDRIVGSLPMFPPLRSIDETTMNLLAALLLIIVALVGWFVQVLGLAGNWLILMAAAVYAWLMPGDGRLAIGIPTLVTLLVLAIVGEIVEFVAGAAGVAKVGGSRRSALLALVGSIVGGIVGIFLGLPIPLVGSVAAAILFAAAGAMAGAFIGESWKGRDFDASLEVGKAAFVGRVLGTLAKLIISSIMVAVTITALAL
jgi:uncharacterized protein